MKIEKSCGFVLFKRINNEIKYLLVNSVFNSVGFAKGHMENNETEIETAFREVKEEVNITPIMIDGFRTTNVYDIIEFDIHKTVVFFLGEFMDENIICKEDEIKETYLLSYEEAMNLLAVDGLKNVLKEANDYLLKK